MRPILYIGNKRYSSWSMRPWLALKWGGVDFEERLVNLQVGHGSFRIPEVLEVSPSGKVPALHLGDVIVGESIAICEWAAEQAPPLWPEDVVDRAVARAAAAEMHAGFEAIRRDMSHNILRRLPAAPAWPEDTQRELERLWQLWTGLRGRYEARGPYLVGERTIADAMYAPVVSRLRTYAVEVPKHLQPYCDTITSDAAFQEWERGAESETILFEDVESMYRA